MEKRYFLNLKVTSSIDVNCNGWQTSVRNSNSTKCCRNENNKMKIFFQWNWSLCRKNGKKKNNIKQLSMLTTKKKEFRVGGGENLLPVGIFRRQNDWMKTKKKRNLEMILSVVECSVPTQFLSFNPKMKLSAFMLSRSSHQLSFRSHWRASFACTNNIFTRWEIMNERQERACVRLPTKRAIDKQRAQKMAQKRNKRKK